MSRTPKFYGQCGTALRGSEHFCGALLLSSCVLLVTRGAHYFYYLFSIAMWIWLTSGLIAASLLQWFSITNQGPTAAMIGIIVLSWTVVPAPILRTYHEGILLLLPAGALTGAFTAGWLRD